MDQEQSGAPRLSIRGWRSIADVTIRLESPLVVLGEDGQPGSRLLRPIHSLVDSRANVRPDDFRDPSGPIEIELASDEGKPQIGLVAHLADGLVVVQRHRTPPATTGPVVYLCATRRGAADFGDLLRRLVPPEHHRRLRATSPSSGAPALELLALCETCIACDVRSAWLVIEEPELFLGPQAQRALAALLRALAACGNQVIYTTHTPNLVDSRHPDGILRVARDMRGDLVAIQAPHTPASDVPEIVRRLSSFDRERNGMFFARRVLLVEGASERLSLPFAFRLLGHEPDAEGVAIVDAGGKGNLPFLARTLRALAIPTVVLHDRDGPPDGMPSTEDQALNEAIARAAGPAAVVQMTPDFEAISGLAPHHRHKPSQAWLRYAGLRTARELPASITAAISRLMSTASGAGESRATPRSERARSHSLSRRGGR